MTWLLREVTGLIRTELNVDPDRVYLAGHSMGGMGITRGTPQLVETYAGFMPLSAGMQDGIRIEPLLRTYFNTQSTQINGLKDHFVDFNPLTQKANDAIRALEVKYGSKAKYEVVFRPGGHNYDLPLSLSTLDGLMQTSRNVFQKHLFGMMRGAADIAKNTYGPILNSEPDRYFWVKSLDAVKPAGTPTQIETFDATADGNVVKIDFAHQNALFKKVRIYLSRRLIDFSQPITIEVNGVRRFQGNLAPDAIRTLQTVREKWDPGFIFENWVDVNL